MWALLTLLIDAIPFCRPLKYGISKPEMLENDIKAMAYICTAVLHSMQTYQAVMNVY